ncbi:hypothetical protein DN824_13785 [Stutzerimonas nosocomialis]|uniref:Uncharacterized protein n=1 Tax=Stutzerimonas nosocomialis TaxID=1056496 RepID=A0A5R9QAC9_9GAMM|nr:hypothetical protein [Stutzerimonas nosocomialis]TLX53967.1 hypothetical protein DN826_16175 [Stutzerimonas nosocomialis]TLX56774.1 hypothetical protein DN824_13785 [Stutzerimonas nosocomialis]TLX62079.1 hypothetical protein DN820_17870 [Stutzerimonas nosocomialis]
MIGDYSSIYEHLETAQKHADQAETDNNPGLFREAIDEVVAAIKLLMRNTQESEGEAMRSDQAQ